MGSRDKTQLELARISRSLSRSIHYSTSPDVRLKIVRKTVHDIDNLIKQLDKAPAKTGKKGPGAATSE
jgi:hypothetical protein